MNCAPILALLLFLAWAPIHAHQPVNGQSDPPRFDKGTIENGTYTNECLGFSIAIPAGWEVSTHSGGAGADGSAVHISDRGLGLLLLRKHTEHPFGNRIVITAIDAGDSRMTAKDAAANSVRVQVSDDPQNRQLVRDAFPVDYAGKTFFRSDYKQTLRSGDTLYLAFVLTRFRGYFVGETLMTGSPEELDHSADSLQRISFHEDQSNPKCVMGKENSPMLGGIIGGVISSTPVSPQSDSGRPMRVRVSQGISQGLLVKKVDPRYPEAARRDRIQGMVVLQAVIDTNGDVQNLTLVSGHPALVPSAVDAAKQWKYKPYRLNGQPMEVETQITVSFQLQEN
ncbi:MAG TPA: energy transducer TonB [Candidatus Acidoferrum sp.]|nr:energy transducer TonB [Candidatus Acidoferrum sp.]